MSRFSYDFFYVELSYVCVVCRTAFLKMIQPKVKTKMGEAIQPMDKSQLVKRGIQPIAS